MMTQQNPKQVDIDRICDLILREVFAIIMLWRELIPYGDTDLGQ